MNTVSTGLGFSKIWTALQILFIGTELEAKGTNYYFCTFLETLVTVWLFMFYFNIIQCRNSIFRINIDWFLYLSKGGNLANSEHNKNKYSCFPIMHCITTEI